MILQSSATAANQQGQSGWSWIQSVGIPVVLHIGIATGRESYLDYSNQRIKQQVTTKD